MYVYMYISSVWWVHLNSEITDKQDVSIAICSHMCNFYQWKQDTSVIRTLQRYKTSTVLSPRGQRPYIYDRECLDSIRSLYTVFSSGECMASAGLGGYEGVLHSGRAYLL